MSMYTYIYNEQGKFKVKNKKINWFFLYKTLLLSLKM